MTAEDIGAIYVREDGPCALVEPKPDEHGFLTCDLCHRLAPVYVLEDCCTSADGLEARAEVLVEYANGLPEGVSTEALAAAHLLRRKARELRDPVPTDEGESL